MNAHLPPKVESVIFCKPTCVQVTAFTCLTFGSYIFMLIAIPNFRLSFIALCWIRQLFVQFCLQHTSVTTNCPLSWHYENFAITRHCSLQPQNNQKYSQVELLTINQSLMCLLFYRSQRETRMRNRTLKTLIAQVYCRLTKRKIYK